MVNQEIKEDIKNYMETNENTTVQNIWDAAKVILRGKFTAIQAYLKNQEKPQINNLTLHIKELKKEQKNPKPAKGRK